MRRLPEKPKVRSVCLAHCAKIGLRFATAVSVAAQKIARQRRFPFRVPYDDAIKAVTGGPSGHPI
jgi:antitoxin component of RelBE/YafQ-DinJ toxin-antitoxin module